MCYLVLLLAYRLASDWACELVSQSEYAKVSLLVYLSASLSEYVMACALASDSEFPSASLLECLLGCLSGYAWAWLWACGLVSALAYASECLSVFRWVSS